MNPTSIEDVFWDVRTRLVKITATSREWPCCCPGFLKRFLGNPQPALRFRNGCRVLCLESHQIRRTISFDRRWCGKYEPGPVCDRKSHLGFFQTKQYGRHHHRLAIHQSKNGRTLRNRFMPETAENPEKIQHFPEDQDSSP